MEHWCQNTFSHKNPGWRWGVKPLFEYTTSHHFFRFKFFKIKGISNSAATWQVLKPWWYRPENLGLADREWTSFFSQTQCSSAPNHREWGHIPLTPKQINPEGEGNAARSSPDMSSNPSHGLAQAEQVKHSESRFAKNRVRLNFSHSWRATWRCKPGVHLVFTAIWCHHCCDRAIWYWLVPLWHQHGFSMNVNMESCIGQNWSLLCFSILPAFQGASVLPGGITIPGCLHLHFHPGFSESLLRLCSWACHRLWTRPGILLSIPA